MGQNVTSRVHQILDYTYVDTGKNRQRFIQGSEQPSLLRDRRRRHETIDRTLAAHLLLQSNHERALEKREAIIWTMKGGGSRDDVAVLRSPSSFGV